MVALSLLYALVEAIGFNLAVEIPQMVAKADQFAVLCFGATLCLACPGRGIAYLECHFNTSTDCPGFVLFSVLVAFSG